MRLKDKVFLLKTSFIPNIGNMYFYVKIKEQITMKPFTFDQIPIMMNKLHDKLDHLEKLIIRISTTNEDKEHILNIEEASKLLNLSVSTIYSKVSKREIPVNKQGKRIYFYRHELMQWIKSGRVKTYLEIQNDIEKRSKI